MYKSTSENLQRAARVGAQKQSPKAIDTELLRVSDDYDAEYASLVDRKKQLEKSVAIINTKIEQYKTSALRSRYQIDNPHYRHLMQERKRLVHAVLDVDAELMRVKTPMKLARQAISQQRGTMYGRLFQQAAKIILAQELYAKVADLAETLQDAADAESSRADPT